MKQHLLMPAFPLLALAALAAEPAANPPQSSTSPVVTATSKATITIDVNGQKQTREIDLGKVNLGNAVQVQIGDGGGTQGVRVSTDGASGKSAGASRTWFGVSTDELPEELRAQLSLAEGTGLLVRSVVADSPAAQAGLLKNDVLAKFDDQLLTNARQLRTLVGTKKEGDTVRLTYLRRGREATAQVKLGSHEGEEAADDTWGLSNLLGKGWVAKLVGPIMSGVVVTDKNGNVVASQGQSDVSDAAKQLEKTLRDAGVDEKAIEQTKKALADTTAAIQKAAGDITATKGDVMQQVQKAVEQAKKALEQAKHEAEESAAKAATPPPKAP